MLIRTVTPQDATGIAALSVELGYSFPAAQTAAHIALLQQSNYDQVYVAVVDEQVIGWIHIFYAVRLECGLFCEIGGLIVGRDHQGKGLGKLLVNKAKEWCLSRGCSILRVRSNVKRTDAHEFYQAMGFQKSKQQQVFVMDLGDAVKPGP